MGWRWWQCNWADTDEPSHPDLHPIEIPINPVDALNRIQLLLQSQPRWNVELVNGKAVALSSRSGVPREEVFLTGPTWPNSGWLTATRRTRMLRLIDDVLIWLDEGSTGCRMHARSRSRIGRGDLGQNRRNLLELFRIIDVLRKKP